MRKRHEYKRSEKENFESKKEGKKPNWEGLQYVRKRSHEKEHDFVAREIDGGAYRGKPQLQLPLSILPLLLVNVRKDSQSIQPPRYLRSSPKPNRADRRASVLLPTHMQMPQAGPSYPMGSDRFVLDVPAWEHRELVLPDMPDGRIGFW